TSAQRRWKGSWAPTGSSFCAARFPDRASGVLSPGVRNALQEIFDQLLCAHEREPHPVAVVPGAHVDVLPSVDRPYDRHPGLRDPHDPGPPMRDLDLRRQLTRLRLEVRLDRRRRLRVEPELGFL